MAFKFIFRPIKIKLPKGSIVNSHFPAPVAVRGITLKRVEDVVCGVMAKALPERMTAAHSGQYTMVNFVGKDLHGNRIQGHMGGPYAGGHGARSSKDGIDVTKTICIFSIDALAIAISLAWYIICSSCFDIASEYTLILIYYINRQTTNYWTHFPSRNHIRVTRKTLPQGWRTSNYHLPSN